jgi:methionyl-tRNA synthetase
MQPTHSYFTTPIYYASGMPHIGHLYANILMMILRNFDAARGIETRTLTGLDEHGEKIEEKARELKVSPQELVDSYALEWKKIFAEFGLSYDVFMRTTSAEHKKNVQDTLSHCHAKGDIYYGEHEGHYCVDCEAFLTEKERDENGYCLIHQKPTEFRKEGNYYFRTSKYMPELRERILAGELLCQPRYINETLSLTQALEGDLSISRPKTRTQWGIELPFDSSHVTYVWFDALPNYVTGVGGLESARTSTYWAHATHILGKDILRFHAIYWPAMLLSLGLPLPRLAITGWILASGHKMSKSLGNVVSPQSLLKFGKDAFVNFALRTVDMGEDMDLNLKTYLERYNADLANGIGNLTARTLAMVEKYFQGEIPEYQENFLNDSEKEIAERTKATPFRVEKAMANLQQAQALHAIWERVTDTDRIITESKPWDLAKASTPESLARLKSVLALALAQLRAIAVLSWPFFPEKMSELLAAIGEPIVSEKTLWARLQTFERISTGFKITEVPKLYARVDLAEALASTDASAPSTKAAAQGKQKESSASVARSASTENPAGKQLEVSSVGHISIEQFSAVQVRVGTVVTAEIVDGSDKLLRLQVSIGELGVKQIFSGIRAWVKPEELVNRSVLVVANLAPRKMKFGTSEGMLLSTDLQSGGITPVYVSSDLKEGSTLS